MSKFYAVAHGFKRGIYEDWNEAKKQIDDFPQPVHKKFDSKEEAEKYLEERKCNKVEIVKSDTESAKFYAVARGKTVGVFTDYDKVKESIDKYPQPLHKKFDSFEDANNYYLKFAEGKREGKEAKKDDSEKTKKPKKEEKEKEAVFYAVARGHKTGVFSTWAECKEQTDGFKGAKFKKFDNEEDAKLFSEGKTLAQIEDLKRKHASVDDKDDKEDEGPTEKKRGRKSN